MSATFYECLGADLEIDDGDEDRNDFTMCELGLKEAKQNMASR